jgi:hypothetical protein
MAALGDDRVLSEGDVELLAATAWTRLGPAPRTAAAG